MRRLLSMLVVIWLTATIVFFALHILPGDAISTQLIQSSASRAEIAQMRDQMGLDAPITTQYLKFITNLLHGDLGHSLLSGQSVTEMISQLFQPTLILALGAMLVATTIGIALGVIGAFDIPLSTIARFVINLSLSTPIYWTGTLAIGVFSTKLGWFPATGTGSLNSLILPVSVLGFHTMGGIARVVQVNVRDVRQAAFIQVARSKGLTERYIAFRHTLRVGLLPVVTVIALQMGFLLGGTVITESLFVRSGIGTLLLNSTKRQDYPVVQGIVIMSAVIYISMNTLADIVYRLVDPRVAA